MSLPPEHNDPESDADLRALFAQQRRGEHADAPVWRDECLRATRKPQRASGRWMMPAVLVAACLALAGVLVPLLQPEAPLQPRLSEILPPLFDAPSAELFADVGPAFTLLESPSDFLLPDHLY